MVMTADTLRFLLPSSLLILFFSMIGPHYTDSTRQLRLKLAKLLVLLIQGATPDPSASASTVLLWASTRPKFTVLLLPLSSSYRRKLYRYSHFIAEETEIQRGDVHSLGITGGETGIDPYMGRANPLCSRYRDWRNDRASQAM